MKFLFSLLAKLTGRNSSMTPAAVVKDQMNEPRPLPMGRSEFYMWSDRIIAGAMIPKDPDTEDEMFHDSQRVALADMITHLGPTESHKPDAHFIHYLRKVCCNQVAYGLKMELSAVLKKTLQEKEAQRKLAEDKPSLAVVPQL